eukprot:1292212-Rhodomonas_salina.1
MSDKIRSSRPQISSARPPQHRCPTPTFLRTPPRHGPHHPTAHLGDFALQLSDLLAQQVHFYVAALH